MLLRAARGKKLSRFAVYQCDARFVSSNHGEKGRMHSWRYGGDPPEGDPRRASALAKARLP
jgi:hypothetical protein